MTAAPPTDPNPSHDFAAAGPQHVTLTVTDNDNDTGTASKDFNVSDTASPVSFVGVNETNANRSNHDVTVPAGTQPGDADGAVLLRQHHKPDVQQPGRLDGGRSPALNGTLIVGRAYTKVATASDTPGPSYGSRRRRYAKSDMAIASYRGATGVGRQCRTASRQSRPQRTPRRR